MDGTVAKRGSAGGKARAAKLSPAERSAIARTASEAKWNRRREDSPPPEPGTPAKAVVALRLPGELMAALLSVSRDEDRSLSWLASRAVREWLARRALAAQGERAA